MRDAREQLGRHRVALVGDEQVGMVDRVEPHLMREAIRHSQAQTGTLSDAIIGSAWSTEESRTDPFHSAQSHVIKRSSGDHQEVIKRSSGGHPEVIRRSSGGHPEVIRTSSGGHQEESLTDPFTSRAWKVSLSRGRETKHRSDCATDPGFVKSAFSSQRAHASTCEERPEARHHVIRGDTR